MKTSKNPDDGLCKAALTLRARQLLGTVCVLGGAKCPLMKEEKAREILDKVKRDPTVTIRLESDADEIPHFADPGAGSSPKVNKEAIFNRKRDLDVLQRLGLAPGDTRRARYLYMRRLDTIATPYGICAYDTAGWEGCALAKGGAYEGVRAKGWKAVVYCRSDEEREEFRRQSAERIARGERIYIRSHHLMCLACWYSGGKNRSPRPNDTLYEIWERIRREPDVLITLIEGCCEACYCCDGFHPQNGRCVHDGGLIRDYKKDLDCFQKLGLMPGATMTAKEVFALLFERIPSTRDICGYGDGVVRSHEWRICGGSEGNPGYALTRKTGIF